MADNYNPMMLGKRVKRLRISKGLNINEFSKMAHVNKNTIVRLEKGKNKTSLSTIFKVSQALEISLSDLLEGEPVENLDYKISEGPETRRIKYGFRKNRKSIANGAVTIGDSNVHLQGGALHAGILEISGKGPTKTHLGEELLFCLTGKVELDVNGKKVVLNKGDSVVFWGTEPHSYNYIDGNNNKTVCLSVLVSKEIEKLEDFLDPAAME